MKAFGYVIRTLFRCEASLRVCVRACVRVRACACVCVRACVLCVWCIAVHLCLIDILHNDFP